MPLATTILTAATLAHSLSYHAEPYATSAHGHSSSSDKLLVDLGYSVYQGHHNGSAHLNVLQGIRFAAPPTGDLRWQAPRTPGLNRTGAIQATEYAAMCPQSLPLNQTVDPTDETGTSEDCLFLNIWSPSNATKQLPVLVWIHGGGYGLGNGRQDLTPLIETNDNSFVGVTIQYRLGAFGFLSSDEVYRKGSVNAGLLDQFMALQWVQQYIHLFGGDASRVTIAGESAGGGSVMLQGMAYGGNLGTQFFTNAIAASPYLPMQWGYGDFVPSQSYYAFATQAGCPPSDPYLKNGSMPIFECLVSPALHHRCRTEFASIINERNNVSYISWQALRLQGPKDGTGIGASDARCILAKQ